MCKNFPFASLDSTRPYLDTIANLLSSMHEEYIRRVKSGKNRTYLPSFSLICSLFTRSLTQFNRKKESNAERRGNAHTSGRKGHPPGTPHASAYGLQPGFLWDFPTATRVLQALYHEDMADYTLVRCALWARGGRNYHTSHCNETRNAEGCARSGARRTRGAPWLAARLCQVLYETR